MKKERTAWTEEVIGAFVNTLNLDEVKALRKVLARLAANPDLNIEGAGPEWFTDPVIRKGFGERSEEFLEFIDHQQHTWHPFVGPGISITRQALHAHAAKQVTTKVIKVAHKPIH